MKICSTRRQFIKQSSLTALGIGLGLTGGCRKSNAVNKPNIFLFLSDDHGIFDTSCYGNITAQTPHIDRLAAEGMCFYNMFTLDAMGPPSRATLYTGLHPHRHGLYMTGGSAQNNVKSLPHYLSELGYKVVLAGKFDIQPKSVFPFTCIHIDQAQEFLQKSHNQPFCLIMATRDPHAPYFPKSVRTGGIDPDELQLAPYIVDGPKTRQLVAAYYANVQNMDAELGDYIELIRETGLENDTMCIYTSDNGPGLPFAKWTLYDAGLNVPFVVKWPARVESATVSKALVSFADVLPTLIESAGGREPQELDGRSFLPVLNGETNVHHEFVYGAHTHQGVTSGGIYPIRSVRSIRYKYIRNLQPDNLFTNKITEGCECCSGIDADQCWAEWKKLAETNPQVAKLVEKYQKRPAEEFYDLQNDPFELNNLAGYTEYQKPMLELRKHLTIWIKKQNDPLAHRI
ncbi:MAG: sulfatase [candidate division KSB1 bacterium]|nr:sulfatase [candidate division KSB1 bacterium]